MSALRPDLPTTLDDWFSRALAIERDARYDDAWTMLAAFGQACRPSLRIAALALDVRDTLPPREGSLPWFKVAAFVAASALIAFVRITSNSHAVSLAHAAPLIVAPLPAPRRPDRDERDRHRHVRTGANFQSCRSKRSRG